MTQNTEVNKVLLSEPCPECHNKTLYAEPILSLDDLEVYLNCVSCQWTGTHYISAYDIIESAHNHSLDNDDSDDDD